MTDLNWKIMIPAYFESFIPRKMRVRSCVFLVFQSLSYKLYISRVVIVLHTYNLTPKKQRPRKTNFRYNVEQRVILIVVGQFIFDTFLPS